MSDELVQRGKGLDPNGVIGGFMSHLFFTVPMALVTRRRPSPEPV